ncbi:MAG: hypothetical protein QOE86_1090 [Solirubrobacteraceae bacterium]|jgi:hypothetical protein|nr:hypothetical protein [Solirubrobacteraceae bacterium]
MAQTKRKRRNKHRGNAVGMVEARGRTSKPAPGTTRANGKGSGRATRTAGARPLKPPSLQSAFLKALVGAVILFIFFRFVGKGATTAGALTMCLIAIALYTPIMYMTDRWIYNRKLKQTGGAPAAKAKPR